MKIFIPFKVEKQLNLRVLKILVSILFVFLIPQNVFAQKPNLDFGDTDGYFYNWGIRADENGVIPPFKFSLPKPTPANVSEEIGAFTIDWGDGSSETKKYKKFPLKHTYDAPGQYNLKITFTYKGKQYTYTYNIYHNLPTAKVKKVSGTPGCAPQTYQFKIIDFQQNPPTTRYRISFGDETAETIRINKSHQDLLAEQNADGEVILEHVFTKASCPDPFKGDVFPYIRMGGQFITGEGTAATGIVISERAELKLESTDNKDLTGNYSGCVNKTVFKILNRTNYGKDGFTCSNPAHYWRVFEVNADGTIIRTATEGVDYKFTNADAGNTTGNIGIIFLKSGKYKIEFALENVCEIGEQKSEFGIYYVYDNIENTTSNVKNLCLSETVKFTTTEDEHLEKIKPTIYQWTIPNVAEIVSGSITSKDLELRFTAPGKYTIQLTKTSLCGTETYDYDIIVHKNPEVTIANIKNYCGAYPFIPSATFNDFSFGVDAYKITEYLWTFNNAGTITTSTAKEPGAITFTKAGACSVKLKAKNACGWSKEAEVKFTIHPIPNADFTQTDVCQDAELTYTGEPDGMSSYEWKLDNNTSDKSGKMVTQIYTNVGENKTTLTVTSKFGCKNSITKPFNVIKRPTVSAGADAHICENNTTYTITDASATEHTSVKWTTNGDGTFTNDKQLKTTYNLGSNDKTKKQIVLTLTAQGNAPCGAVIATKTIYLQKKPSIEIKEALAYICQGESISISNSNIDAQNYKSLKWTADKAGTFSSDNSISTKFTPDASVYGEVTLTLTAQGLYDCTATSKTIKLNVVEKPTVNAGEDRKICIGETISLNGKSNSSSNLWIALHEAEGIGTLSNPTSLTSATYTPSEADNKRGYADLRLKATGSSPCKVYDDVRFYILKKPTVDVGKDKEICKSESAFNILKKDIKIENYSSVQWSSSGTGTFTNGNKIDASYTISDADKAAGSVTLMLTVQPLTPCAGAVSDSFVLNITPEPSFDMPSNFTACEGKTIDLIGSNPQNCRAYEWKNQKTGDKGKLTSPDKITTQYIPDATNPVVGDIVFTLIAYSLGSCKPTAKDIKVTYIAKPKVNAGADKEICSTTTSYKPSANGATNSKTNSIKWEVINGDGSFNNPTDINAIYTPGTEDKKGRTVTLKLTGQPLAPCAAPISDEMKLTITPEPTAFAGNNTAICQGTSYKIADATAENYQQITWSADFCNFDDEHILNPTYTPNTDVTGKQTITMKVTGKGSCATIVKTMEIDVTPAPTVAVTPTATICENGTYQVINTKITNASSYSWSNPAKGTLSDLSSQTPLFTATETGATELCLTVQGNGTCKAVTACTKVNIVPHPTIEAGADGEVCSNATYAFNVGDEATKIHATNYNKIEYKTSGDGNFINVNGLQAQYIPGTNDKNKGTVKITIEATQNNPCNETVSDFMTLTITPEPKIEAGADVKICQGASYELVNAKTDNTSQVKWLPSDKGTFDDATKLNTTFTPNATVTGKVTLTLTAKGNGSCADAANSNIVLDIVPNPTVKVANPSITICKQKILDITGTTTNNSSKVEWTTSGAGSFTDINALNPTYTPSEADYTTGKVELTVKAIGLEPCTERTATATIQLNFKEAPIINAGADAEICQEEKKYQLSGATANHTNSYKWTTNGKGSITEIYTLTPTYVFAKDETGTIKFTLHATGNADCDAVESSINLTIVPTPVPSFTIGTNCVNSPTQFTATADDFGYNITNWEWNFGDGATSTEQNPTHTYTKVDNFTVTLKVTNSKGCVATISHTTAVNPLPIIDFSKSNVPDKICQVKALEIVGVTTQHTDNNTLKWSVSPIEAGSFSVTNKLDPKFIPNDTYSGAATITLTANSKYGCSGTTASKSFEIIKQPTVNPGIDHSVCVNNMVDLSGTSDSKSNIWSTKEKDADGTFADKTKLNTSYKPGAVDIARGYVTFMLSATGNTPCVEEKEVKITIVPNPIANAGDDANIRSGENYTLITAKAKYQSAIKWTTSGTGTFKPNNTTEQPTYVPSAEDLAKGSVTLTMTVNGETPCTDRTHSDEMILSFTTLNMDDDKIACQNEVVTVEAKAKNYQSVQWESSSANGTFANANSLTTTYTPGANETGFTTLTLTITSKGGSKIIDHLKINFIAKPKANAGDDAEICSTATYQPTANGAKVTSADSEKVLWTTSGDGIFDNANSIDAIYTPGVIDKKGAVVTLTLQANPLTPCAKFDTDVMELTITPKPIAFAGANAEICQATAYKITDATATHQARVEWTATSGTFTNGNTLTPTYIPEKETTGTQTLTLTAYGKGSCAKTISTIEVFVTPAPTLSITDKATICEDGYYQVVDTKITENSSLLWTHNGKGTLENATSETPKYIAAKDETGTVKLLLTVNGNGSCKSITGITELTIVPHPTIEAGDDDEVCSNAIYTLNAGSEKGQIHAENYSAINFSTSGDGNFIDKNDLNAKYIPSKNDKANGKVKLTIHATQDTPCNETVTDFMTLIITPAPEVEAGMDVKICQGASYKLANAKQYNTSQVKWLISDKGTFDDATLLNATFTPNAAVTGKVVLTLTGQGEGSCAIAPPSKITIDIVPNPSVNIKNKSVTICKNKNYELSDVTTENSSKIIWNTSGTGSFADANALNPIYEPSDADYDAGKVILTVAVLGLEPCTDRTATATMQLNFMEAPFVSAGANHEICQEAKQYQIKAKSATITDGAEVKNIKSFYWTTNGKGNLLNEDKLTPTYIFAKDETGVVELTLNAKGLSNCDATNATMQLNIIPTPKPDFTIGTNCIGETTQFTDISKGFGYDIKEWQWNFGDGTTSTEQHPTHSYTEAKDFTVTLTTVNSKGCKATITKTATVHPLPVVDFDIPKMAGINLPVKFTNKSTNTTTYKWEFGDGNESTEKHPEHSFATAGFFTVSMQGTSAAGCSNSNSHKIEIVALPIAKFIRTPDGCGPLTVAFTNKSVGKYVKYFWDFGNGQKSTKQNPDPVIYKPGILADTVYHVTLTVTNIAGKSVYTDDITVKPLPIPKFDILPNAYGCTPVTREFFNHSQGQPTDYTFDFGDGTTYSYNKQKIERPFPHAFTTGKTKTVYPVTLIARNGCGERSITKNMTVYPNSAVAVMKVVEAEGCVPFTATFENLSKGAGDYLKSEWIFEDNIVEISDEEGKTVQHTFKKPGEYIVKLTVRDTCAMDATTRKIIVHDVPELDFDISNDNSCEGSDIVFTTDKEITDKYTNFTWNLGDGTIKKGINITHQYNKASVYNVELSAISIEFGCKKSITKMVTINAIPKVLFDVSANNGCEPLAVAFTNNTTGADYYKWEFGDGNESTKFSPNHTFNKGTHKVILTAESKAGCVASASKEIRAYALPDAQFELAAEKGCNAPFKLEIKNSTKNKNDNVYTWDFGNGQISQKIDPDVVKYNNFGTYKITLRAQSPYKCSDTFSKNFTVNKPPKPAFELLTTSACEGDIVKLQDKSENTTKTIWRLGDDYVTIGKNASHIFKEYGTYDLFVKVIGEGNCADSIIKKDYLKVYPKPIADFDWANVNTPPEGVNFPETVTPPNNGVIKLNNTTSEITESWIKDNTYYYKWDFNDGEKSEEKNPVHRFKENGKYQVEMFATTAYGCKDSISKLVKVNFMGGLFVPNAFNPNNPSHEVGLFLPKGIGLHKYHIEIQDKYGNIIWVSDKITNGHPGEGWDGRKDGKLLPQGVYIWKIRAQFKDGTTWKGMKKKGKYLREGTVTLIR